MLYHPFIIEILMKQRQAELRAAAQGIPRHIAMRTKDPFIVRGISLFMVFLADILIKTGTSIKKHWVFEKGGLMGRYASSLNGK